MAVKGLTGEQLFDSLVRATGFREVVETVAAKGGLRRDLSLAEATDVLLVTFGDATYVQLATERGWSHEAVVDWCCAALPRLLLDPPDPGADR